MAGHPNIERTEFIYVSALYPTIFFGIQMNTKRAETSDVPLSLDPVLPKPLGQTLEMVVEAIEFLIWIVK